MTRTCIRCGAHKPLNEFPKHKRSAQGRGTVCKTCRNRENREGKQNVWQRNWHMGLSQEGYESLLKAQEGGCAGCGSPVANGSMKRLHVDHDHTTGEVRGLLCSSCNLALGLLKDDIDRVLRLACYLEERR